MNPETPDRQLAMVGEPQYPASFPGPFAYLPQHYAPQPGFAAPPPPEPPAESGALPLSHYLWLLRRHRWKIIPFVLASVIGAWVATQRMTPVYEATVTVDIDRQTPTGVIGQDAMRSMINDSDQFLATQIRLVQSDSVLRPVAAKYNLLEHEGQTVKSPDAPVTLKNLKVARPPNTYLLLVSYRSPDSQLAANVANHIARSYLDHTYNIRITASRGMTQFMEDQLEELRAKMERSSLALARFERELNVINPEEKTSILSARLMQLNQEYTSAQSDRVRKEAAYQSSTAGTLEAAQVSTQGEGLKRLMERLLEARERFAETKSHYGPNHPEFKRLSAQLNELERQVDSTRRNIASRVEVEYRESASRERMLERAVVETKAEFDRLNSRSYQYASLKREADGDKKLYEELVRKIKEASINAGFQNSSVRVADPARPPLKPVFPNLKLNLVLAFLLSTLLAFGVAVASDAMDSTVRDPEQSSRMLGADVIGSLPIVKNWRGRLGLATQKGESLALVPASQSNEQELSGFGESIRTLRNSILLADFDRRYRSILITSASPGEGKSTTAANFAIAHAEQGARTLLIDGDLRRPSVHRRFKLPSGAGLSEVLNREIAWRDAVVQTALLELAILPAGAPSRRASDLIGRGLAEILDQAGREYDLVVLDAPPLLGFSEPLQMATAVDGVVIVVRAGQTERKAVRSVVASLQRLRANVIGVVLNGVHKEMSDSYYYYGHYSKYYAKRPNEGADGAHGEASRSEASRKETARV